MKTTKYTILLAVIALLAVTGVWMYQNNNTPQETQEYYVQACHYVSKDITCAPEPYDGMCTLDIKPSDFCGQFVACSDTGEVVKDPRYDTCIDCTADLEHDEQMSEECAELFPKDVH